MNCQTLAERVQNLDPTASTQDVARTCLLLSQAHDQIASMDDETLNQASREMELKFQVAIDQHAAMTEELEALAQSNPAEFDKEQIWVLIRSIKVQSQVLSLYLGEPALDI